MHRFTFDGRYAYLSPELDGYLANIVMIFDLIDPAHPREIELGGFPGNGSPVAKVRPGATSSLEVALVKSE